MNVALAAAEKGFKVGICSREMTDIQFGQRILSYETYMDGMKIRKADITDEDWVTLAEALEKQHGSRSTSCSPSARSKTCEQRCSAKPTVARSTS